MRANALKYRQDERRERLTKAATRLIARSGPEGLRMKTLADELDLTAGALYRYFPSKAHLLAEVERTVVAELADLLTQVAAAAGADPADKYAALVDAYWLIASHDSPHFAVLAHFVAPLRPVLDDEIAKPVIPEVVRLFAVLGQVLAELSLSEPVKRAALLWSALHGILERRKLVRFGLAGLDIDSLYRETATTISKGWHLSGDLLDRLASAPTSLRPRYLSLVEAMT